MKEATALHWRPQAYKYYVKGELKKHRHGSWPKLVLEVTNRKKNKHPMHPACKYP